MRSSVPMLVSTFGRVSILYYELLRSIYVPATIWLPGLIVNFCPEDHGGDRGITNATGKNGKNQNPICNHGIQKGF